MISSRIPRYPVSPDMLGAEAWGDGFSGISGSPRKLSIKATMCEASDNDGRIWFTDGQGSSWYCSLSGLRSETGLVVGLPRFKTPGTFLIRLGRPLPFSDVDVPRNPASPYRIGIPSKDFLSNNAKTKKLL
ncbi:hypothetical protein [Noviherbaspirillum galbum]|uniref:hypothetical protein n=1 Tax=Noviherbaspirillum galbum TaxID=2709383 RepID=UPI00196A05EE|nr:hypothetical protein [Noviherbaspirillum galbum]